MSEECNNVKKLIMSNLNLIESHEQLIKESGKELEKSRKEMIELDFKHLNNLISEDEYEDTKGFLDVVIEGNKKEHEKNKEKLKSTLYKIKDLVSNLESCELKKIKLI